MGKEIRYALSCSTKKDMIKGAGTGTPTSGSTGTGRDHENGPAYLSVNTFGSTYTAASPYSSKDPIS